MADGHIDPPLWGSLHYIAMAAVIRKLQVFADHPERLARIRRNRFRLGHRELPNWYCESELPPSPSSYHDRESYEHELYRRACFRALPFRQFRRQAQREASRLVKQRYLRHHGRPETLPYDETCDIRANAENNVRGRWLAQGIWARQWGPAWPAGSRPLDPKWAYLGAGPFVPSGSLYNYHHGRSRWYAWEMARRWAHEHADREEPGSELRLRPLPVSLTPPAVGSPMASRPANQFAAQVAFERDWVRAERFRPGRVSERNLTKEATAWVRADWEQDSLWNPNWGDVPGMYWRYEDPNEVPVEQFVRVAPRDAPPPEPAPEPAPAAPPGTLPRLRPRRPLANGTSTVQPAHHTLPPTTAAAAAAAAGRSNGGSQQANPDANNRASRASQASRVSASNGVQKARRVPRGKTSLRARAIRNSATAVAAAATAAAAAAVAVATATSPSLRRSARVAAREAEAGQE